MNILNYSADEVLNVAVEIEHNASTYYRQAAMFADQERAKSIFMRLSDMENNHAITFERMRKDLSPEQKKVQPYDPGNEMHYYLENMAGLHAWEGKAGPQALLTGREPLHDVYTTALNAERETVYFYTFLKDFVPLEKGKKQMDAVIHEEMQHVAILNRELSIVRSS